MPFNKAKTTIELHPETRNKLKTFGVMGDSYNDLLNDLINLGKKHSSELQKIQEKRREKN